jgi:DNA-binding transcriptional ArsR family regulator
MAQQQHRPDYDLQDQLELDRPEQLRALSHPLRYLLLGTLLQRAATISHLAEALGQNKGNISHHLKVLEEAGLVRVVRTRRVQGGTERYWGRTAWMLHLGGDTAATGLILRLTAAELLPLHPDAPGEFGALRTRLSAEQVEAFSKRLLELAREFDATDTPGEPVYGLVFALAQADVPTLPEETEQGGDRPR